MVSKNFYVKSGVQRSFKMAKKVTENRTKVPYRHRKHRQQPATKGHSAARLDPAAQVQVVVLLPRAKTASLIAYG
jgi:hypothetical protein